MHVMAIKVRLEFMHDVYFLYVCVFASTREVTKVEAHKNIPQ